MSECLFNRGEVLGSLDIYNKDVCSNRMYEKAFRNEKRMKIIEAYCIVQKKFRQTYEQDT